MNEPNERADLSPYCRGWYYVRYKDGAVTGLMHKSVAKEYANIFGGEVLKHSKAPPWWKFWKSAP